MVTSRLSRKIKTVEGSWRLNWVKGGDEIAEDTQDRHAVGVECSREYRGRRTVSARARGWLLRGPTGEIRLDNPSVKRDGAEVWYTWWKIRRRCIVKARKEFLDISSD